jgi:hypothetical protein
MINDTLLINLKIISKIPKNGRICRSYDGVISLEQDSFLQSIRRFLTKDSRKQALFEINSIINECICTVNNILNSKYINSMNTDNEMFIKHCEYLDIVVTEMENAKGGLQNLKFTYTSDHNVASQLDIALLKMSNTIKDVRNKLKYLSPDLSYNQPEQNPAHAIPIPPPTTPQQLSSSITRHSSPQKSSSPDTVPSTFFQ